MTHNINEVLSTSQPVVWLPWAAQYIFYLGCSYGAIILFAISYLSFFKKTTHHFRTLLLLVALISSIIAPIAINGDLHQPERVWHFYAYFTPWSWMSIGSTLLPIFTFSVVGLTWLYLRQDLIDLSESQSKHLRLFSMLSLGKWKTPTITIKIATIVAIIFSFSIVLYTSKELGILKSRPQWHLFILPIVWFISAFMGSIGFSIILKCLSVNSFSNFDLKIIKSTALITSLLSAILFVLWFYQANLSGVLHNKTWTFYLTILAIAMLGSIIFGVIANKKRLLFLAFLLVISPLLIRFISIVLVQTIPKYDAGIYPYNLPIGADGFLGIIGLLGLWICLASLLSWVLLSTNINKETSYDFEQLKGV